MKIINNFLDKKCVFKLLPPDGLIWYKGFTSPKK